MAAVGVALAMLGPGAWSHEGNSLFFLSLVLLVPLVKGQRVCSPGMRSVNLWPISSVPS